MAQIRMSDCSASDTSSLIVNGLDFGLLGTDGKDETGNPDQESGFQDSDTEARMPNGALDGSNAESVAGKAVEDYLLGRENLLNNGSVPKKKKRKVDETKGSLERKDCIREQKSIENPEIEGPVNAGKWATLPTISDEDRKLGIVLEEKDDEKIRLSTIISQHIKPHQVVGARFIWYHLSRRHGCVLADYMGLGKTLQTIAVLHAFFVNETKITNEERTKTALVLAPTSVVLNWKREIHRWFDSSTKAGKFCLELFNLKVLDSSVGSSMRDRLGVLSAWQDEGGILIMGYEMYRLLSQPTMISKDNDSKAASGAKQTFHRDSLKAAGLLTSQPGPSLVIVDEGHRLRHTKSQLVKAISQIKTHARLVLSGYPLQNHLEEYWCMVNFVRPNFLGTMEQFKHRFKIPIENGQAADANEEDALLARSRTFVLHEKLSRIILRRDGQILAKELPPKYQWVLQCRLTPLQSQLYRALVRDRCREAENSQGSNGGIIAAYHHALSITNHPQILFSNLNKIEAQIGQGEGDQANSYSQKLAIYEALRKSDPERVVEAGDVLELTVATDMDALGLTLSEGVVSRMYDRPNEKSSILYVSHIPDSCQDVEILSVGCELVYVGGSPTYGTLGEYQKLMKTAQETGENFIVLTFCSPSPTGFLSVELARLKENSDGIIESNMAEPVSALASCNRMITEDEPDVVIESTRTACDTHSLSWAEPLMTTYSPGQRVTDSGKMMVLFSILKISRMVGDKVIVFSQSVVTLNIIEAIIKQHNLRCEKSSGIDTLDNSDNSESCQTKSAVSDDDASVYDDMPYCAGLKCGYLRLDGSTIQAERTQRVNQFNKTSSDQIAVFLASTRAAGEGINLQAANRVVLFDTCWNPCLDHEAMCRAYRFGQTKPTFVYRLVAAGTIERTVFDQQTKKEGLTCRVLDARATRRTVRAAELRNFFDLKSFNMLQREKCSLPSQLSKNRMVPTNSEDDDYKGNIVNSDDRNGQGDDVNGNEDAVRKMKEMRALEADDILREILSSKGHSVTKYKLEDLLMDEDEFERSTPETRQKALEEYDEFLREEKSLIERRLDPGLAAAKAWEIVKQKRLLSILQPNTFQDAPVQNFLPSSYPLSTDTGLNRSMHSGLHVNEAIRAISPSLPRRLTRIFQGVNFFILRRRMDNSEELVSMLRAQLARCYIEMKNTVAIRYVISQNWSLNQLERWKDNILRQARLREQSDEPPMFAGFEFKTFEWVKACINSGSVLSGGCPEYQQPINTIDEDDRQNETFSSPYMEENTRKPTLTLE